MDDRSIHGEGTPEALWQGWAGLDRLPTCNIDDIASRGARTVVVAPHPDDEVLACGGLLAMLGERGRRMLVVAVTDGDASHAGSRRWTPARLAQERHAESVEGLARLGLGAVPTERLGIPDGRVEEHRARLTARLRGVLEAGDVVVTTWLGDGHPDHEACGHAVADACAAMSCRRIEVPVWMWHWAAPGDRRVPWQRMRRLPLTRHALQRKSFALAAHVTQLHAQDTGAPPVLGAQAVRRLIRPHEYFLPAAG